jgi:hypothetical protein
MLTTGQFIEWANEKLFNTNMKKFLEWMLDFLWLPSFLIWKGSNNGPTSLKGFHSLRKLKLTPNCFRLEFSELPFIQQYRLRMTAYKDSGLFQNLQEAKTLLVESGYRLEDYEFDYKFISEIISNNCVIAKERDGNLIALNITHKGQMQKIPMSMLYNETVGELEAWLTSDIFLKNRREILAQCRMASHEWYVRIFAETYHGVDNPIPTYYIEFHRKFREWEDQMAKVERERFLKEWKDRRSEEEMVGA